MLSIEDCKKHLEGIKLADEEIKDLRDLLYAHIENILDTQYMQECNKIKTCKKQ